LEFYFRPYDVCMMFLLRMLMRRGRAPAMDPLQVSMTGVRMGERFLLIGCHDRALLSGLAAKVGLSGTAAVAAFDKEQEKRAAAVGAKVGALIDTHAIEGPALPFDGDQFDMVVVDDTTGEFGQVDEPARIAYLRDAARVVRRGGRIEVVEGASKHAAGYDVLRDLSAAGFKPVRELAQTAGFRFVEGLRPQL
jgi:ubiquinone/menaquinone biosynthesis C-methylase UbiE